MSQTPNLPPAGWYPDPAGSGGERFWDGTAWSQSTRDLNAAQQAPQPPAARPTQPSYAPSAPQQHPYAARQQPYQRSYQPMQQARMVPVQGRRPLATFGKRLGGYIVDFVLLYVVSLALSALFGEEAMQILTSYINSAAMSLATGGTPPAFPMRAFVVLQLVSLLGALLFGVYRTLMLRWKGQTLGQMALGLKTVRMGDETNGQLTWKEALIRGLVGAVIYQYVGFFAQLTVLVTSRRQTVPDLFSKTVVIDTREEIW